MRFSLDPNHSCFHCNNIIIAAFAIHKNYLLCGVIETLQLWDVDTGRCVAILSTPRDDYVQVRQSPISPH